MKTGKPLEELSAELERRSAAKRDLVAPVEKLEAVVVEVDGRPEIRLAVTNGTTETFGITPHAHCHLSAYADIPLGDYRRMQVEAPGLLVEFINRSMRTKTKDRRMLRTLDGAVRAFLDGRHRVLDNEDVVDAVLPVLIERELIVLSSEITERRLYIKAVDRSIERDVPTGRWMGDSSHGFFDTISPGIVISYCEADAGPLSVETCVWTKACTNLAVVGTTIRTHDLAGHKELSGEDWVLAARETRELSAAAIRDPLRKLVASALDEGKFEAVEKMLKLCTSSPMESSDMVAVVERVGERFGLDEGERMSVLRHLARGRDFTRYGLQAAITRASAEVEDYERATELERLGGRVILLSPSEWNVFLEDLPHVPPVTWKVAS
ncbi:MAG TPA: hypothetical protein VFN91_06205 [Myxococcaceae bacterium]|nr:hypothetical protein [Myxococcaceae bacterium]